MDLMKIGTDLLMSKLGANGADGSQVSEMLGGLLGGGSAPDLGGLLSNLQGGGAADAVKSWLGSGENEALDPSVLSEALDSDKLAGMASQLGVDQNDLLGGLADAIPQMVDKASPNGELLDIGQLMEGLQGGGAGGIMGMIGKLFGK
ncbi:MAG: YidB family protein [Granulosicoccaceae bacterium]